MNVKIIKSNKPTYWYASRIGEVFKVKFSNDFGCDEKWEVIGMHPISYIDFDDCEVYKDEI